MSKKTVFNKESLADQVYSMLEEDLTNLKYPLGSRIVVEDIEKELGISRIPIRDALQKLTEKGLVIKKPRVGFFVTEFNRADIEDLYRLRTVFENYSLSCGFRNIDRELLAHLKERYEYFNSLETLSKEDEAELFKLENKFHQDLIIKNSSSELMYKFYSEIKFKINLLLRLLPRQQEDVVEHLDILNAIIADDQVKARKCLNFHLVHAEEDFIRRGLKPDK